MNTIREWINQLVENARKKAILAQQKRELDERLFLFAIEIGRSRKLLPEERRVYAQTFRTAQIVVMLEEEFRQGPVPFKVLMKEPEEEWLLREPVIKAALEYRLEHPLSDLEDVYMSHEDRNTVIGYLHLISSVCPDILPPHEVPSIVDRLDHPLDRA